jgi:hypothetical protein
LADPNWTQNAAAELGSDVVFLPKPYLNGFEQLRRNRARAASMLTLDA